MTLYELTDEYKQVLALLEDDTVDEQTNQDTLEALGGEIEDKADGYAKILKELEAKAEKLKKEEDRLHSNRQFLESNIVRLKASLQGAMEATGKTKFKTDLFSFGIQNNPASVFIPDENAVPEEYLVWSSKVDRNKIKDWLKAGNRATWAELQQTQSLRIR